MGKWHEPTFHWKGYTDHKYKNVQHLSPLWKHKPWCDTTKRPLEYIILEILTVPNTGENSKWLYHTYITGVNAKLI